MESLPKKCCHESYFLYFYGNDQCEFMLEKLKKDIHQILTYSKTYHLIFLAVESMQAITVKMTGLKGYTFAWASIKLILN